MNPKSTAIASFVLTGCVLSCACTTVDKFTIHDMDDGYGQPASLEQRPIVLKEPCKYAAGTDISGKLSPGPLQPSAIATPGPFELGHNRNHLSHPDWRPPGTG